MTRIRLLLTATCILCLLMAGAGTLTAAPTPEEVEEDCSLASNFQTPHRDFAPTLPGGPLRVLFFCYTGPYDGTWEDTGTRVREPVELAQRFDMRSDAVLFCGPSGGAWNFHGGSVGAERAEKLLAKRYDLFVFAGFDPQRLPAKFQYLVLKQVSEGAGILCCGPGAAQYFTAPRKLSPTPDDLISGLPNFDDKPAAAALTAYRLGKGRGVWLNYATQALVPTQAYSRRALAEFDYRMLVVGRAALWAAGRTCPLQVTFNTPNPRPWRPGKLAPAAQLTVTNTAGTALDCVLDAELCRLDDGRRTKLGLFRTRLAPGAPQDLSLPLPSLRAGDYILDVVARDASGTVGCAATNLQVVSDFGLERVETAQRYVERGDSMGVKVFLRGTPPAGSKVQVRLCDSYDRILAQREFPVAADTRELGFDYATDEFCTIQMRAEAALLVGGEEVEVKDASFTVPKRRQGQMNFVMWDTPTDPLGVYAWDQMRDKGIHIALIGSMGSTPRPTPTPMLARDVSVVPYSTRILDDKNPDGTMKPVCWNDEPAVSNYVQGIVDRQQLLREAGVFVYSLGDEGVTKGCCISPACLNAYRKWLQGQYGTIDALNASWGSTYKSFDEVQLLDPKDNMELAAQKTSPARWYDRQAFARYNLMHFVSRFSAAYSKLDPYALTGFEGTGGFGDDYDAILGINGFYGPYPSIGDDIVRSAARREMVRSNWMGYSKTGDALSDAAWRMVMKGMDSIWYWMWSGIGNWRGYLRPTLDLWPAIEDLAAEMKPVRQGLGDLLLKSQTLHSGIAIVYSLPSALSGSLENSGRFVGPEADHIAWTRLTYELGLDFRYVTDGMLRSGALDSVAFKVAVLPMAQAIGPDQAAALRKFVEAGGTLIADVRPGIYDGHCKPVTPGVLDDLFGIKRVSRDDPVEASVSLQATLNGHAISVNIPRARVDAGVETAGATALGTAGNRPVLLVNEVGRGRAILLNFQPITSGPTAPETNAARSLLQALYDACGARSAVRFRAPDGGPLPLTETRIWRNGSALVFGLWRQMENAWFSPTSKTTAGEPQPARIELPGRRHLYDLRAGRYLGQVSSADTRLRWGRANFFLALPYRIGPVNVALDTTNPQPGQVVRATVKLDIPPQAKETFAAWVEVTDPAGNKPLWGRQVVLLTAGQGQACFKAAINDMPGTWTVRVTELFSGQSAEASWRVR
jgi:hypothetical protein